MQTATTYLKGHCHFISGKMLDQNRRQKVFNGGFYAGSGGFDILKFDKNYTDI